MVARWRSSAARAASTTVAAVAPTISRTSPAASHFSAPISDAKGASHWPLSSIRAPGAAAATARWRSAKVRWPSGVKSTSINAGTGKSASSPPAPSQGSSRRWISASGTGRTAVTPGMFWTAAAAARASASRRAGLGLDHLDGDPAADLVVEPGGGAGQPHAGGGGEHGQKHHDRDHPGHRPGDPPLGEQAALGGAEFANPAPHASGRFGGWRSAPVGSAIWPRSSRNISACEISVSRWRSWVATTTVVPSLFSESNREEEAARHFRIDIAGRLVGDQQFGPADHRAGDRDPLLLAPRQGRGARAGAVGEPDPGQHLADRSLQILVLDPRDPERQRDIVEGRKVRDQPEILENDPDPPAKARQAGARHGHDILAEQPDQAAARAQRQIEQFEQRRLARAGGGR